MTQIKQHTDEEGNRQLPFAFCVPEYITNATIYPDNDHFVVDFIQNLEPENDSKVLSRLIFTPDFVCDLIDTLEEAFDHWCDLQHEKMAQDRQ